MNSKIISENQHPLIKRKEIILEVEHNKKATPKTADISKMVAEKIKSDEKLVSIKSIKDNFGSNTAHVKAYVYADENAKSNIEDIKKKKALAEKIKAEHAAKKAAAEAPKEEAKAEEKTE